jgi:hypothetical protein
MLRAHSLLALAALFTLASLVSAATPQSLPSLSAIPTSGGLTNAGLNGEYFTTPDPKSGGKPLFSRRDLRINFHQPNLAGSAFAPYNQLPVQGASVRWTGQFLPTKTEAYTFHLTAAGNASLFIQGKTVTVNQSAAQTRSLTLPLNAGQPVDLTLTYTQTTPEAHVVLEVETPTSPRALVEPLSGLATNVYSEGFTDAMRAGRDEWKTAGDGPERDAKRDENGYPLEDAKTLVWEGTDQHEGTYLLTFKGKAEKLDVQFGYAHFEDQTYDEKTNTTTAKMVVTSKDRQNFNLIIQGTQRTPDSPKGSGVSDVHLYMPTSVGASDHYAPGTLFTDAYKTALARFTALRFMAGTNWNNSIKWSDSTSPDYSTQRRINPPVERFGEKWETSGFEANGIAWEYKIALANETGKDLYVCLPEMADDEYITSLAQAIKFGSDGKRPYTSPQASPKYPPLNSNLRVYVEYSNEVWNVGFAQWHQNYRAGEDAAKNGTDEAKELGFDEKDPKALDGNTRWNRRHVRQTVRASNLFRQVFGDDDTNTPEGRVRVLHYWQYDNAGWPPTALAQTEYLANYYGNYSGNSPYPNPKPPSYFIWAAGGATYYNAANERGRTTLLDGSFESPTTQDKTPNPTIPHFTFSGDAGIVRCGGSSGAPQTAQQKNEAEQRNGNQPAAPVEQRPASNNQAAYLTPESSISVTLTFPKGGSANQYALEFSLARKANSKDEDAVPFDILLDDKPITRGNSWQPGYYPGPEWREASSEVFHADPGSTHTLKIVPVKGAKLSDGAVSFLDDLHITSADALFAADIPSSGFNNSNINSLQGYQRRLDGTANWALALGLRAAGYEGGWALGGDAGGSPIQNWAKFHDPRAKQAQIAAINAAYKAAFSLNTFGTYSQWSAYETALGEPLPQGIDTANNQLPPARHDAIELTQAPLELPYEKRLKDWGWKDVVPPDNKQLAPIHMLAWTLHTPVPITKTFTLTTADTSPETQTQLLLDGVPLTNPSHPPHPQQLSPGLHTLRVRVLKGNATFQKLEVK